MAYILKPNIILHLAISWLMLMVVVQASAIGSDVSSQIDLDSDDDKSTTTSAPNLKAVLDLNKGAAPLRANVNVGNKHQPKPVAWRPITSAFAKSDPVKRRRNNLTGLDSRVPNVINNIQIIVNGNETDSETESRINRNNMVCKNSVCNISVVSKPDGIGNIVTDVRLSIITRIKTLDVEEIPIIDGVRGNGRNRQEPPQYFPLSYVPHVLYDNLPQIQTHRPEPHERRFYYGHRTFQRPPSYYHYQRIDPEYQGQGMNLPDKTNVDDKIEPPLSKTTTNDKETS
ncbi:uncharacterized protein [Prorops nasuta]|uniref:uncharacterized protein n=1 Tax=Prorops nasuta TaxID=863751 RepID=UPI0034CE23A2